MELDKSDERIDMLLGKKENPALTKVLGKKFSEDNILSKHTRSNYEKELVDDGTIKCPKCGHEFKEE